MNKIDLAYHEQERDLHARIEAHKRYASIKVEDVIEGLVRSNPPLRVCDLGCGSGNFSGLLSRRAAVYVGIDINEELLAKARETVIEESNFKAVFMKWDMNDPLPFVPGSFDLVFSAFSAYYVKSTLDLVRDCRQQLSDGGRLWILGPAPGNAVELDQISDVLFGRSATGKKVARLDRLRSEFVPVTELVFGRAALEEFDISLAFPSVDEYCKYYMAAPQFKELLKESSPKSHASVCKAIETLSSLKLTKKVLLIRAEKSNS